MAEHISGGCGKGPSTSFHSVQDDESSMTFLKQYTGKTFWYVLGGLVALDIISFLTLHTPAETVLFVVAALGAIGLAFWKPEYLFPIALAEIIATSNGHSLGIELLGANIGIRIMLFVVLMLATLWKIYKDKQNPVPSAYRLPSALLVLLLIFSVLQGWLLDYSLRDVYLDANGYLAIGYVLAAWTWTRTTLDRKHLLEAAGAGTLWIVSKTLLLFFAFGHLHPKTLDPLYLWIRDTRLGEITLQRANIYRVFLQSQWYLVPALLTSASYMLLGEQKRESGVRILHMLTFAALIASLSRTFWLALAVAAFGFVLYVIWKRGIMRILSRAGGLGATKVASIALLWILIAVPIFQTVGTDIFGGLLRDRATGTSDAALDSRAQLLHPMIEAVEQAPLAGHGLGKNVTYETSDPRYIDTHSTNIVSTYAFEWGWLDILVKFGLVGLFILTVLLGLLTLDLWRAAHTDKAHAWLYLALLASLVALVVAHGFSPYLNHPIGWGMIALIAALIPRTAFTATQPVDKASSIGVLKSQPSIATRK